MGSCFPIILSFANRNWVGKITNDGMIMGKTIDLQAVKDRYGGLVGLDFTAYDLPSAHLLLGKHVKRQVHKILRRRLGCLDAKSFTRQLSQARSCHSILTAKSKDLRIDARLRLAVSEYLECLAAWTEGAGLSGFTHPALHAYLPVEAIDLALYLQHDASGCQTGMYRTHDGSVILWHTEEDVEPEPGSGFDQLRMVSFNVGDHSNPVISQAFTYPDLLPGPAFGWRTDGYTQAVDTLHIKALPELSTGVLANVVTWLTLRLGSLIDPQEVIEALQPYVDGYALNTVYKQSGTVRACKYEFASNRIMPYYLDEQPGSYFFQGNIFTQKDHPWVLELEDILPYARELYQQRQVRTQVAIQNKDGRAGEPGDMRFFFELLSSKDGDRWAYANQDVKAYFILRQAIMGTEVWLGHGPALQTDLVSVIRSPTG
jgi:hypothetical protein